VRVTHPVQQRGMQTALRLRVLRPRSHVLELIWILTQIVQFFFGALGGRESEITSDR
jgi:hypothetical protein